MNFRMPHIPFTGTQISAHTMVIISDSGKRAVYSLNEAGKNFGILKEIEAHQGSMTVLQLARAMNTNDIEDLKIRLRDLKHAGYIRFGGEMADMPIEG